jgi:sugar lactone lactonase YvrE
MNIRNLLFIFLFTICSVNAQKLAIPEHVTSFKGQQVTGVTVSTRGRIFANFPRWRKTVVNSVVEVQNDGSALPYPNKKWNQWQPNEPVSDSVFVAVQSVVAFEDHLYVLDTRNPLWQGVVDAPRIFVFNLKTNQLETILKLSEGSYKPNSYTNDLCIDKKKHALYITDSNEAGLIVYNLNSNSSRRVLDNHFSTKAETSHLTIDGSIWGGKPVHSDGIAFDSKKGILYFHALTGYTLYAIPSSILCDGTSSAIERKVFKITKTPAPDGMVFAPNGNLYLADLEKHKIVFLNSKKQLQTLAEGETVGWADTFSVFGDYLYFTNSKIHQAKGDISNIAFTIQKIKIN